MSACMSSSKPSYGRKNPSRTQNKAKWIDHTLDETPAPMNISFISNTDDLNLRQRLFYFVGDDGNVFRVDCVGPF